MNEETDNDTQQDSNEAEESTRLSDNLLEMAGTLQLFAVQILSSTNPGTFENNFANPAVYAAEHARRLARIIKEDPSRDIDSAAWSTRCLYETRMALDHLMSHPKPEAELLMSRWVNQGDVLLAKTLTDLYLNSDSETRALEEELKKFGRPHMPKQMAEMTGSLEEHRMMYGLLCLYTHPSTFLLFGNPQLARSDGLVRLFCARSLYYLQSIHRAIAYVIDHIA